ncbi:MAG TPA: stage II sporulation protein M [bacterium]|jgi:stage II sporulation protein M|nr:stage II sporulation protein M [bacterium]
MLVWRRRFQQEIRQHVGLHQGIYFFVILLFLTGVVFGALAVRTLADSQKNELMDYLQILAADITTESLPIGSDLLLPTLWSNARLVSMLWLGGLTIVGLPFTLILLFGKGFSSGFTVAFLVQEVKLRGFILAGTALLPHSLFLVPALLFLSAGAISFAYCVLRQRFFRQQGRSDPPPLTSYLLFFCYAGLAVTLASLVEAYITPVLTGITAVWLL